ncbi:hypothetical protein [Halorussus pelagicus]|uniref:hypothetical protein n=1 Tax=Halorussus pelagicus TaxID=2505977 RepID=UPI001FB70FD5|nr:hypothetical protein [Halorussus pelagicus]
MSGKDDSERTRKPSPVVRGTLALLSVLVMLYSLLIATRPLLGVLVVALLFVTYLLWRSLNLAVRFVAAFERIADAMENRPPERHEDRARDREREF